MNKRDIQLLFEYNRWANAEILRSVSELTPQQLTTNLRTSHGSVHGTLTHTLSSEWIWLTRCQGVSPKAQLDPADFPGLAAVRTKWTEVEQNLKRYIDALTDEMLKTVISYTNTQGEQWSYPLWQIMQHVVNHSSYHRGQIAGMLRQLDAKPAMTDYLVYFDKIQGA